MAAKDSLVTRDIPTTAGSRILENFKPVYDGTAISKIRASGAVLLGKTNMDEFGMGSSTENSSFFTTHNPWNFEYVPGGSSGGAAAAVAAGLSTFGLAEDTGGSIRMPAAFCGVTGLKTTYGRVSRYGLLALASSFDTIGPIAHDVMDCALIMEAIAGHDPMDSTTRAEPVPKYAGNIRTTDSLRGIRLGIPKEYFVEGLDQQINKSLQEAHQGA